MIWSIRERRAFERLARRGSRIRTSTLWCNFLLDPDATPPRVAFSIGRNVGRAVVRNRVRRRLRAALGPMSLPSGWYVIGTRPSIVELTFAQISTELELLFQRLPPPATPT